MSPHGETLRIGTVGFVNALPLTISLEGSPGVEIVPAAPSALASMLRGRSVDAALLPVAALFRMPDHEMVPGIGICARGPVRSVVLFHRGPVSSLSAVGRDTRSVSSNALARALVENRFGARPRYADCDPSSPPLPGGLDGAVVIGDQALLMEPPFPETLDLAQAWLEWKGLPFVFAAWAVRKGHPRAGEIAGMLTGARDRGAAELERSAQRAAQELGRDAGWWLEYLRGIRYAAGGDEEAGIREFEQEVKRTAR